MITTTVGRIQLINCAISPGWLIPASITAAFVRGVSFKSMRGTPTALLKLPSVASIASSPQACLRMEAIICVVVVLPLDPTTQMSGIENCARQARASAP